MPAVSDGFTVDTVTAAVAFGLQGFFLIFVIVSPIGGWLLHQQIKRRSSVVLVVMSVLFAFNLVFLGITYVLGEQTDLNTPQISIISLASAGIAALLTLYIAASLYAEPTTNAEKWEDIVHGQTESSFQEKRFERLKKRGKR